MGDPFLFWRCGVADDMMTTASLAAGSGAVARIVVALQGGSRGWKLAIEGFVGGALGVIAASFAIWFDPSLRTSGWPLMITSGAAGLAGALGTRGLDILTEYILKKGK